MSFTSGASSAAHVIANDQAQRDHDREEDDLVQSSLRPSLLETVAAASSTRGPASLHANFATAALLHSHGEGVYQLGPAVPSRTCLRPWMTAKASLKRRLATP